MIILWLLIIISFITIVIIVNNREAIFMSEDVTSGCVKESNTFKGEALFIEGLKRGYSIEENKKSIEPQSINLDNKKYYVEIRRGQRNTLIIRVNFKNGCCFLHSENYVNKTHAIKKAKELAMYLKCELRDNR